MTDSTDDDEIQIAEIASPPMATLPSSAKIVHGKVIPPQQHVLLFSEDEWEAFIEEWASQLKTKYEKVARLSGPGDMGIDVAGFSDEHGFNGAWDNYQCKHYGASLTPSVAIPEIGKCLWYAFNGKYTLPRKYFFMAPKECGLSLKKMLLNSPALKAKVYDRWDDWCANSITTTQTVKLQGEFLDFVDGVNFSIFDFKTTLEVLDEHRSTPYHVARFGGGLPDRPHPDAPPRGPHPTESRYLEQLFEAYSEHKAKVISDLAGLSEWPDMKEHYQRQREVFYHAESLRNFARDTVPPGTFEDLQDEVHSGVVGIESAAHPDGYVRVNAVTQAAAQLPITSSALISVTKIQDKCGICHQLANENRLQWVKK